MSLDILNDVLKKEILRNLSVEEIAASVWGECRECPIMTPYGVETVFYGNREAFVTLDLPDGNDVTFTFFVDTYGETSYLVSEC